MRLYIDELHSELSQKITPDQNRQIKYIRPHLYLHNKPSGSVKIQVCAEDGTLISESDSVAFSAITSASYFHGYVRFSVSANMQADKTYTIKLVSTGGYSFSESAYCAFVKDSGFKKYTYSAEITDPRDTPFDLEIWSKSAR